MVAQVVGVAMEESEIKEAKRNSGTDIRISETLRCVLVGESLPES